MVRWVAGRGQTCTWGTALLFMASGIPPQDRLDPDVAEVVERVLGGRRVGRFARTPAGRGFLESEPATTY